MDPLKKPPKRLDHTKITPVPWKKDTDLLENISIRPLEPQEKVENTIAGMKLNLGDFEKLVTDEGEKKAMDTLRYMRSSKTPEQIAEFKSAPVERNNTTVKSPRRNYIEYVPKRPAISKYQHRNLYQIVHGAEECKIIMFY